ncbi:MAG: SAM-dependent methyltransferase [Gemmatimonadetes bacterium]|nr:SAM-dependent methyltransferase [Gemmatimonadota bacterium]
MTGTFGTDYAQQYDLLYQDKDYDAEVALLERLFTRHALRGNAVLDLGCGTGQHAIRLAKRGYDVTGVDRSPEMLRIARVKAEQSLDELSPQPSFVEGDITSVKLGGSPFDAALMMFAVLGYQVTNEAVRAALGTARAHVRSGALFVCDVWYGPAVLSVRPSERTKVVDAPGGQVIRSVRTSLDTFAHRADVDYRVWRLHNKEVIAEMHETHAMRFFFPQELMLLFEAEGFELVELRAFGDDDALPTENSWNVLAVARAK